MDYILGPKNASIWTYIHNDVKTWSTWAHFPVYAVIQEDDAKKYFKRKDGRCKGYAGWRPTDEEARTAFKKATMPPKRDDMAEDNLEEIQKKY